MTYIKTRLKPVIKIDEIITVHYFEYMKDFVFMGESHDFWEFLYVDKGSVSVRADDSVYTLNAGDIIFHKPYEFHAIRSEGKKAPNLIAVSFYSESPAISWFCQKRLTLRTEERLLLGRLINEARDAFTTPLHIPSVEQVLPNPDAAFGAQQMVSLFLELFLVEVCRHHFHPGLSDTPPGAPGNIFSNASLIGTPPHTELQNISVSERIEVIEQYLEFHICEQLTVTQICSEFSLARSTLQSLFKREKGCGIMDYFQGMKIERAKEIMRDGTMNLTEISYYLSYSSLQYFSKQFKKATGMSPLEYVSSIKGITQAVKNVSPRHKPGAE